MGCRLERARSRRQSCPTMTKRLSSRPRAAAYCVCRTAQWPERQRLKVIFREASGLSGSSLRSEDVLWALIASCWSIPTRRERALESSWGLSHRGKVVRVIAHYTLARLPERQTSSAAFYSLFLPMPLSMASFASRSASLFPPRSVWRIQSLRLRASRRAPATRAKVPGLFTLYCPFICFTINSESEITRIRPAPFASAHSSTASRPEYSRSCWF